MSLHKFLSVSLLAAVVWVSGCARPSVWTEHFRDTLPPDLAFRHRPEAPRHLAMFDGQDGRRVAWLDLLEAVRLADVVIVGEQHDDATGHAVELVLVRDALANWAKTAVSLEMLERDDRDALNEYLAGEIERQAFIEKAGVADWAGEGTWERFYQPVVDAAKDADARVIAANAPRKYAGMARTCGYAVLRKLDEKARALFHLPEVSTGGSYSRRFRKAMRTHKSPGEAKDEKKDEKPNEEDAAEAESASAKAERKHHRPLTDDEIEAMFRAQELWDATMASSIIMGLGHGAEKVIHLVGGFHSDHDGGLVQRLRLRKPGLRVLSLSLVPVHSRRLRREDRARADVVVYTGVPAVATSETQEAGAGP
jgi:uncharacterized iron-regulated protein